MNYEKQEQLKEWFDKYDDYYYKPKLEFETLASDNKFHSCKQISAIMFLASKLKNENYPESYFLQGEHDILYIGSTLDIFKDFNVEDVKIAVSHGISMSENIDGFQINASM